MTNLFPVLEGIATSGRAQDILANAQSVKAYAALQGKQLVDEEAEHLLAIGRYWASDPADWPLMRSEAHAALSLIGGSYTVTFVGANLSEDERQRVVSAFCETLEHVLGGRAGVVKAYEQYLLGISGAVEPASFRFAVICRWQNARVAAERLAFSGLANPGFFDVTVDHPPCIGAS